MDFRYSEIQMQEFLDIQPGVFYSDTLALNNQQIHYVFTDMEHEVLVVFVHGSPGSWNAFSSYFQSDSLLERYDMVSVDRPGFGFSDHGIAEPSLKKQADAINEVLKLFDHKVKILVGHSLGGPVIARMAMEEPEISHGLLFLAPSIDPEMEKYEWYRILIKTRIGGYLTPTDFWVSNEEIVPLKDELQQMVPLWSQIVSPAIVIHGTQDSFVPAENADFAERMMGDSLVEIRYLEGARHFIPWTHSAEIVNGLDDLIVRIYSSSKL